MFSNNTTSANIKQALQTKMAENMGLDNISKSSIANHITDAVSGSLADGISLTNQTINNVYTNMASGEMLTANAYEFGVIRSTYSDVYLTSEDQVVEVSMGNKTAFPSYFEGRIVIPKGREFTINNSTTIQFVENVYLEPGKEYAYVSVKVSASNSTDVPENTRANIATDSEPITNGLIITFKKPVNFRLVQETDEELRRRVQIAKLRTHGSSEYSIMGWVESTPTVIDYKFEYSGNTNTYNIYVVTKNYKETFSDPNIGSVISSIKSKLDMYVGAESKFSIDFPELYKISFAYKFKNSTPDVCNSIIEESFNKIYQYKDNNSIDIDALRKEIATYMLDINLENIIIFHDDYGIIEAQESGIFEIPNMAMAVVDHTRTFSIEEWLCKT